MVSKTHIFELDSPAATIWVAWDGNTVTDYAYGGCRIVAPDATYQESVGLLCELMQSESGYKNSLINQAIGNGAVDGLGDRLPPGFRESRVGGGRCILRPKTTAIAEILADPSDPRFTDVVLTAFDPLGEFLNELGGRVKLTPDFGKYAGVSDLLHRSTDNVLGIRCEDGGCGGKASYSASGVVAAYRALMDAQLVSPDDTVTLVGSEGAMGTEILGPVAAMSGRVRIGDLQYDDGSAAWPEGHERLASRAGMFTDLALDSRCMVAATWGMELMRSNLDAVPSGSSMLLAHNLSIPSGNHGLQLADYLHQRDIFVVPGQLLTLGGALTSRLEWFSRTAGISDFDKTLAHEVVGLVVTYWMQRAFDQDRSPYEYLLDSVGLVSSDADRSPRLAS